MYSYLAPADRSASKPAAEVLGGRRADAERAGPGRRL